MADGAAGRAVCPGVLAATAGGVWVVDRELPVVVFVDGRDLSAELAGSWFGECALRDWAQRREICTAVAGTDDGCWVASPHARGVIWLRREGKSVYRLPAPVRALATAKGVCWALLDLGSRHDGRDPLPLWRLDGADVRSFSTGVAVFGLVAAGDEIFALGQVGGGGSDRFAVLHVDDDGQVEVLAEPELRDGWHLTAQAGPTGPWIEVDSAGAEWPGNHWIEPLVRSPGRWRPGNRVPLPLDARPVMLDDDNFAWSLVWAEDDVRDFDHMYAALRRPLAGSADSQIVLPGEVGPGSAGGGRAWYVSAHRLPLPAGAPPCSLLRLTYRPAAGIELARVPGWPGIGSLIPRPRPPEGVDPAAWAEAQRASLEDEFAQDWTDTMTGETRPFIDGATIESVSLAGSYPATEYVIRFRLRDKQGRPFGRRIRCFDDLGVPYWSGDTAVTLMEDIATGAVPPPGRDFPAADGVVWI